MSADVVQSAYAVAPSDADVGYLTPGKRYPVLQGYGGLFEIVDDDGDMIVCRWMGCNHLAGRDWRREPQPAGEA